MSANGKNEKTAHLVWCAMIALRLARQDGRVQSEQQENLFLVRWFADAERQRRFSRDVASDISCSTLMLMYAYISINVKTDYYST
ncbi:TPA: DUF2913 family protein [Citrobacter freundii]|nr:DUF2913 family protein [Citrobacter sp. wls757]HAP0441331.1 DUF2913 family protein [Escherichia coli]HDT5995071.1 DUF2913 family protein [Citrobacter freundii]HDT6034494.1 DUF2913 family protein [Citrobacter freundii]